MKTGRLAAWILLPALLFSLWGCRGTDGKKPEAPAENEDSGAESVIVSEDGTRWLTHIYKSHEMEIPDGWELDASAGIDYDAETDEFRGLLFRAEETEDENGVLERVFEYRIILWDGQGKVTAQYPLNDAEHRWRSFGQACFWGDLLYALLWEYDGEAFVGVWDIPSGELKAEKPTAGIENWDPMLMVRNLAADGDGNLYAGNGKVVTVLSPVLVFLNSVKANTFDMKRTPEGEVWAVCADMAGRGLFRIDPETGREKLTYLDASASQIAFVPAATEQGWAVIASTGAGICRFSETDGGKWASEELMSFANSSVSYNFGTDVQLDAERMAAAADEERFAFVGRERVGSGEYASIPRLYEKAPDLDLAAVRTVTLAHVKAIPDSIRFQISRFNREQDEIRVTTLDYSSYNNDLNPLGGAFRLATDLLNGLISPDLVYGETLFDPIKTLMRDGRTVDLGAYLDADPELNRLTVAECVLRAFDDGQGGIWGLSPFFRLRGVAGSASVLGEYADGWDLDGFLDFAAGLPESTILTPSACSEARGDVEFDYAQFIGEDGCSFDSPSFIRYLDWLKALPTAAELGRQSPAAGLYREMDLRPYYADGTVALQKFTVYETRGLMEIFDPYEEGRTAFPGFPAAEGSGVVVDAEDIFVIPSGTPDPDAAWAFLRSVLLAADLADTNRWNPSGMPAYLPALEEEFASHLASLKVNRADGGITQFSGDHANEAYIADFMSACFPGMAYTVSPFCSEEDVRAARELIRTAGRPFREQVSDDVKAIVNEELSAFLGGVGTAEECAAKIQSRVSIWLAENQ